MKKKIYIVTSGEYSDYGIEAVFENKVKALAFAKAKEKQFREKYQYNEYFDVKEYETHDDDISAVSKKVVYLYRHYKNIKFYIEYVNISFIFEEDYTPNENYIDCMLPERDDEKAYKILQDKIAEYAATRNKITVSII